MTLEELKEKRKSKLEEMKALNEANPTMKDDVLTKYQALERDFEKLNRNIKLAEVENTLASEVDDVLDSGISSDKATASLEYVQAFDRYLAGVNLEEARAEMTEGVDADGGYTVPESYQKKVVQKLNNLSETRKISDVITTVSTKNIPTEGEAPTFTWIEEKGTYGETKATYGKKQLGAYKLGGIIKVSEELLQDTAINFEDYMAGQIAKGIDKAEAPAFAVGDGNNKPTGYVVSAPVGTDSTTAGTDTVTADELIDIHGDLPSQYRKNAVWRMTDKTAKAIRKLKDSDGNYIFDKTLDKEGRQSLLNTPIVIDNSMPEIGTGNKFIVIGDFNYFQIGDRGGMTIQRLNERYADEGMVGFKVTKRVDAKVIIEEAFNAGKNAS